MKTLDVFNKEDKTDHDAVLEHVRGLIDMSRNKMTQYYDKWDQFDKVYQAKMDPDENDKKAKERKEPVKMVVPVAHSQIQTFVSFGMSLITQKEFFYEIVPMSPESASAAQMAEGLLDRDLRYNNHTGKFNQFLLDIGRFGLGIIKTGWEEETQMVSSTQPGRSIKIPLTSKELKLTADKTTMTKQVKYQGNKLWNVSPYTFFPDPRIPIGRFQEGEFVGSEDVYSLGQLKNMQSNGILSGVDDIPKMKERDGASRTASRIPGVDMTDKSGIVLGPSQTNDNVVVTEVEVKLIPKTFIRNGKPLGEEDYEVKFLVWYANDAKIIRMEPLNYLHDMFTYVLAEFHTDNHHFLNDGLVELIDKLQDVINWFINSHITSVRKVIQNWIVVDPEGVEIDDIKARRPMIRLKTGASRKGVDQWIKQLNVVDATANHMTDAEVLNSIIERVTGINENMLGQFHSGRRSATEARNVNANASARLKTIMAIIYFTALEPLGRQMISNLRDGLTIPTYVKIFGSGVDPMQFSTFKQASRDQLVGNYEFQVFDGTLPSEKDYVASALQEILMGLLGNPEAIPLLGLDPKLVAFEWMRLKGIKYPQRFAINNPQTAAVVQQTMNGLQPNAQGGAAPAITGVGGAPGVSGASQNPIAGLVAG